jgi:hypothetical protein
MRPRIRIQAASGRAVASPIAAAVIATSRCSSASEIDNGGISTTTSPSGRTIAPRRRAASVTWCPMRARAGNGVSSIPVMDIEARVREVRTKLGAGHELRLSDLPLKRHERVFHERVPLPPAARARIELSDEWRYAQLATLVEAWGFRASHDREQLLSREEMAAAWFRDEYEPVVAVLNAAGIGGAGTDAERYLRIAMLRFLLLQTHDWTDDVVERLLEAVRPPSADDDTMVQQILKEMS